MNAHELKQAQVRITKLAAELAAERDELKRMKSCIDDKQCLLDDLNNAVKQASMKPTITEHALLRYAERVLGMDLEAANADILSDRNIKAIKILGSGKYPIGNGCKAVVKGMTVVSVV